MYSSGCSLSNMASAIPIREQARLLERLKAIQQSQAAGSTQDSATDIATIIEKCIGWMLNEDDHVENISIVGLLTSELFAAFVQGAVETDIIDNFRDFLLSISLAYGGWRDRRPADRLNLRDLHRISHLTGSALIQRLDRTLSPQNLGKASTHAQQALFLVVFGTTLGVAYSTQILGSPEFPTDLLSPEFRESPTLWIAMKEHLCHMLAHHLILLASWLGYKLTTPKEQMVIETAVRRWNRPEAFMWANPIPTSPASPPLNQGLDYSTPVVFDSAPTIVPCPAMLRSNFPASERVDLGRRRTMIVVEPWEGQQVYARIRTSQNSDKPGLMV